MKTFAHRLAGARTALWKHRRWMALVLTALAVELLSFAIVTTGHLGSRWPHCTSYLDDLAEGLRHGHLHLQVEPPPALLAQPNPFDPRNRDLWYWDASLYRGHYYLYWGPVPAVILAAAKVLLRIAVPIGDEYVVFALTTLQLVAGTLFVARAGRRLYASVPLALEMATVALVGIANPVLYDLGRAAVYEAAIVGGHAFILLGLLFAVDGVTDGRPRYARFALAGVCWAAALGCRVSLAPAVALLVLVTVIRGAALAPARPRAAAGGLVALGLPVLLGLGALLSYNRLRFDAWMEFGRRYQMSWINSAVSARFVVPNVRAYLLRPPVWSCRFPFAFLPIDMGARAFPAGYQLPDGYFVYESVGGILRTIPWSWLAPLALLLVGHDLWLARARPTALGLTRTWAVLALTVAGAVSLLPATILPSSTNRYLGDVVGALVILSGLGSWALYDRVRAKSGAAAVVVTLALLLAVATAGFGVAFGLYGQYGNLRMNNPRLLEKLVRTFSVCRGAIPPEPT